MKEGHDCSLKMGANTCAHTIPAEGQSATPSAAGGPSTLQRAVFLMITTRQHSHIDSDFLPPTVPVARERRHVGAHRETESLERGAWHS